MADALSINPQIKGLRPAIGRRQVGERFVMDGTNFLVDAEGPYSEFGSDLMFHEKIYEPQGLQTFEVGNEIFLVNNEGFFAYDETANILVPRYVFDTAPTADFPMSMAKVGGTYYFARKGIAEVISYNPTTRVIVGFTTDVPTTPHAVAAIAGRLVVLGATEYAWSAQDNGSNLAPSTTTGAGIQSLALIENGDPLAIFATDNGGIVYTTKGLIKIDSIDSINPFRHYVLVTKIRPITEWAVVDNDGEHIFLAETGFYTTRGKKPERWQTLMSEYYHRKVLGDFDYTRPTTIRLWYNYHRQWLFVSHVDTSGSDYLYDYAYALYLPRDEWGIFNRQHYSIGEFWLDAAEFEKFNAGYIDASGHVHKFTSTAGVEQSQLPGEFFQNHLPYEIDAWQADGTYHFSSVIQTYPSRAFINLPTSELYAFEYSASYVSPDPVTAASEITATATLGEDWQIGSGAEDWETASGSEDWEALDDSIFPTIGMFGAGLGLYDTVTATPIHTPLNSHVEVGLFRISDQLHTDKLSYATDIAIGTKDGDDYDLEITGTIDGITQFEDQTETPTLEYTTAEADYYSCYCNGIWQYVTLTANSDNQKFHLKLLEVSGNLGGRL